MQKLFRSLTVFALSLLIIVPVFAVVLNANAALDPWGGDTGGTNLQSTTGLGSKGPQEIAASVINVILGFLGIVAVVLILLGGFKWMTAQGAEEKVEEAKKLITAAIIGLIIILAAFGISKFVLDKLITATTT